MEERKIGERDGITVTVLSQEELHKLIRDEVRKALADILAEQARAPYKPRNIEYKSIDNPDLPAWARNGQWS